MGFAHHGRVTFSLLVQRESNQRENTPGIRVSLRSTSLIPVPLRGPCRRAIPGQSALSPHPCGSSPYATPPLGLLTGPGHAPARSPQGITLQCLYCFLTALAQTPPKSPSGGRAQSSWSGLSGMDAARAAMGQGWPFAACPRSDDGAREPRRSRGRMMGWPSFWLLFLGQTRKSNSPERGEMKG